MNVINMENAHEGAKELVRKLNQSIRSLSEIDAGKYMGDPDQPMENFIDILVGTARKPLVNDAQLRILLTGIEYLIRTEADDPHISMEDAIDAAMREAIVSADTLQSALLALAMHRLQGNRIEPLNV